MKLNALNGWMVVSMTGTDGNLPVSLVDLGSFCRSVAGFGWRSHQVGKGDLWSPLGMEGFTLRRLRGADRLNLQACKRDQQGSRDAAAGSTFVKRVHPVP